MYYISIRSESNLDKARNHVPLEYLADDEVREDKPLTVTLNSDNAKVYHNKERAIEDYAKAITRVRYVADFPAVVTLWDHKSRIVEQHSFC